jgi:hypothetical protein
MRAKRKNLESFMKASKIGYILRTTNRILKSNPKNYTQTKEWRRVIAIACRCTDLPFLTLYISNVDGELDIAAFERSTITKRYGKLVKIIKTPMPKKKNIRKKQKPPNGGLFLITI